MTFPDGKWRPVKEVLKRVAPFETPTGAATFILSLIAENKELEAAVVTARNAKLLGVTASNMPSPDHACARTDTQVVVDQKNTTAGQTNGQVERIAALFTDLEWRDAVLPKRLTPLTYAAQLIEMFPDKDLVQQITRAQIWHLDRNPSWKRLAHSLNGWLAKPTPEWEKEGQQSMFKPATQSAHQDYTPEPGRTDGNDF
jgi:hypothetical protein